MTVDMQLIPHPSVPSAGSRATKTFPGIAETIDWYRANESWWAAAYDAAEAGYAEREQEL